MTMAPGLLTAGDGGSSGGRGTSVGPVGGAVTGTGVGRAAAGPIGCSGKEPAVGKSLRGSLRGMTTASGSLRAGWGASSDGAFDSGAGGLAVAAGTAAV